VDEPEVAEKKYTAPAKELAKPSRPKLTPRQEERKNPTPAVLTLTTSQRGA
jgi:hypothetical protein